MAFNIALSGLKAASNDLKITGNNIANASTTGFKESRAEFADVYAASILGSGANQIGSGVRLADSSQQFEQGTVTFTSNSLDVAIDGEGFFILNNGGATSYTRAGLFGLDEQGFIVTNSGARLQGFTANESETINGILGDLKIETGNLAPKQTTAVESQVNVDAQEEVKAEFGTTIATLGAQIGRVQSGVASDTPSTRTSGAASALQNSGFDFSKNTVASITAAAGIATHDFSINVPTTVTASNNVTGHNFSINSPSTLSAASAPVLFNFANKASAVTGTAATVANDFTTNNATFDVTIAGGSGANGSKTVSVTLNKNITNISDLLNDINDDLAAIDVTAVESPAGSGAVEFRASVAGEASTVTVGNYAGAGVGNLPAALSNIAAGSTSSGSTIDISIAGGTNNGKATINLNRNITGFQGLIADIQDQLSAANLSVDVRSDPSNSGRLQFFSTDNGVASIVTVDNFKAGSSDTSITDVNNLIGVTDGATSSVAGAGAIGAIGSLTSATFDVHVNGDASAGPGSVNRRATITLDKNFNSGDVGSLVTEINNQLSAVAAPGIDVRVREAPDSVGQLEFYSTVSGVPSVITVENFTAPTNTQGTNTTDVNDIRSVLGGIADGTSDNDGQNNSVQFQVQLTGSTASKNGLVTINLDKNVQTLSDLISDIRDELQASGIGLDVREDPTQPGLGKLQFFATASGEDSTILIDPNNALINADTTQTKLESVLGGLTLGAGLTNKAVTGSIVGQIGELSAASFDVTLSGAATSNGTVKITLDSNITTVEELIADIQDELRRAGNIGIDVREDPNQAGQLQFFATVAGEESVINVTNFNTANSGVQAGNLNGTSGIFNFTNSTSVAGVSGVDNGYSVQSVDVVNNSESKEVTTTVTTLAGESAAQVAARFSQIAGVSANAKTEAVISDFTNDSGGLTTLVNGVKFTSTSLAALAADITASSSLRGIAASYDDIEEELTLTSSTGQDIVVSLDTLGPNDTLTVEGEDTGNEKTLNLTTNDLAAAIGGTVSFILDEKVKLANDTSTGTGLFGSLADGAGNTNFAEFELHKFNPTDQETYNSATSQTIYDSLGNSHIMTQFFVKNAVRDEDPTSKANQWTMYIQIDGDDVGDPDLTLAAPDNAKPTQAGYKLQFDETGRFVPAGSDTVHITNWTPDPAGDALGPINVDAGAITPIPDPPTSSNFIIDMSASTQHGSIFSVDDADQNGFTTGRLSGLDIADDGIIFARYTNGENQILGQVTLANFANAQGLVNLGGTTWAQTAESGEPVVGTPQSSSLGTLNSGALEESNVELSDELVRLIIAQRNFQANAKTIQTADAITQTIINLR